jgi:hypothetical protein
MNFVRIVNTIVNTQLDYRTAKFISVEKWNLQKNGRKSTYNSDELIEVIKFIWLKTNQLCSKRLKLALPMWLPYYAKTLSEQTLGLLSKISASSIDRLLKPFRITSIKGKCTTNSGKLLA